jgi:hypothetical protein
MLCTAGSSMRVGPAEGPVRNRLCSASGKTSAGTRAEATRIAAESVGGCDQACR